MRQERNNGIDPNDIFSNVAIKNRIVDGPVFITWNGKQWKWEPGETKQLNAKLAEWFRDKSRYRVNPGDVNEGIPARIDYKLVLLGRGDDETDITREEVLAVKELLDVQNMPDLQRIDPSTGKPMRRVYIDPRSTGANDNAQRMREARAVKEVSSAIVRDTAERLAEAAEGASEEEIVEAVAELTGTKADA